MACLIPSNLPIFQALLDKANSFPSDKIFHILSYHKAAKDVALYPNNIYCQFSSLTPQSIPFYGPGLQLFIHTLIQQQIQENESQQQKHRYTQQQRDEYSARRTRRALAHCKAQAQLVAHKQSLCGYSVPITH